MNSTLQAQVLAAEERLRQAQLNHDLQALDELISPDLLFTGHQGQLVTKEDDLAFHRQPVLNLTAAEPVEQHIQLHPNFAVVSTLMHLVGEFQGAPIDQRMRYTRVWTLSPDGTLQLTAGHMSELPRP